MFLVVGFLWMWIKHGLEAKLCQTSAWRRRPRDTMAWDLEMALGGVVDGRKSEHRHVRLTSQRDLHWLDRWGLWWRTVCRSPAKIRLSPRQIRYSAPVIGQSVQVVCYWLAKALLQDRPSRGIVETAAAAGTGSGPSPGPSAEQLQTKCDLSSSESLDWNGVE